MKQSLLSEVDYPPQDRQFRNGDGAHAITHYCEKVGGATSIPVCMARKYSQVYRTLVPVAPSIQSAYEQAWAGTCGRCKIWPVVNQLVPPPEPISEEKGGQPRARQTRRKVKRA